MKQKHDDTEWEGSELEQYRAAFFEMMRDEQPVDVPTKVKPSRLPTGYSYKPYEEPLEDEDPTQS